VDWAHEACCAPPHAALAQCKRLPCLKHQLSAHASGPPAALAAAAAATMTTVASSCGCGCCEAAPLTAVAILVAAAGVLPPSARGKQSARPEVSNQLGSLEEACGIRLVHYLCTSVSGLTVSRLLIFCLAPLSMRRILLHVSHQGQHMAPSLHATIEPGASKRQAFIWPVALLIFAVRV